MADMLTPADIMALKNDDGENGIIWILLLAMLFGGGGFGVGGNRGNYVSEEEFANGLANQSNQQSLQQILLSSANNNYETAQLISGLGNNIMSQFFNSQLLAQGRFAAIDQAISNLGFQMEQCCCSIKTQMLQDRYEDARAENVTLKGIISNDNQTQQLLATMGRWVGWTPSGTQTLSTGT